MRNDYFAAIKSATENAKLLKKLGNLGNLGNFDEKNIFNKDLNGSSSVTQPVNPRVTRVTEQLTRVTRVTQPKNDWVTQDVAQECTNDGAFDHELPRLPKLPKKIDNPVLTAKHLRDATPAERQALWRRVIQGEPVAVYSESLGEAVYWVRDEVLAKQLAAKGERLVCYSVAELKALAGQPAEFLRDIHALKKTFDARLENIEPISSQGGSVI